MRPAAAVFKGNNMNTWGSSAVDRFPLGSGKVDLTSSMSRVNASTPKTAGVINDLDAEETMQNAAETAE